MLDLRQRSTEKEILDEQSFDETTLREIYGHLALVNQWLGGRRTVLLHLEKFSRRWESGRTIKILDVGSGGADIPKAIVDWARKKGIHVFITALDLVPVKGLQDYPEIQPVIARHPDLPFAAESFDYVITSLFFHHLSDAEIPASLIAFDRIARRGILVNDLVRSPLAYFGFRFFCIFTPNEIFRKDGFTSIKRAFVRPEVENWIAAAGLSYLKYSPHFAWRFALAGEK